ncbi:unnamed protein product [Rangifer tarandus platyrhynchus]|uniref:Uncharacterized protein n=2 Tax=Rangifer tarandus platyrhynchus TaxID=3082113 RepID=A0AC59YHB7_RANTA|nr:unnamed protein product [Rangifer tarandus platyrhynchus]
MNQKLEVKLVDMGTNSEEQCNAASFFLVANPNVQSVRPPRKPGLFSPHLQATDGNSRGSGGRSAALRSRDKPLLHKPRGDRDDSTQCPLSPLVRVLDRRTES